MTSSEVRELIREETDDPQLQNLVINVLEWEEEKLHHTRRRGKKDAMKKFLAEYVQDK